LDDDPKGARKNKLQMNITNFVPFPTISLPKPLKRIVERISLIKCCNPAIIAMAVIVRCASSLGGRTKLRVRKGWNEGPQVYAIVLNDSGNGKSHQLATVVRPIQDWQTELFAKFELEFEAWKKAGGSGPRPKPERLWFGNGTSEVMLRLLADNPHGILRFSDEGTEIFDGMNQYKGKGNDEAGYLSAWSAEPSLFERLSAQTKDHHGIYYSDNPSLCILTGTQPETWRKLLSGPHRDTGLLPRIVACMPPAQDRVWLPEEESDESQQKLAEIYRMVRKTRSADGSIKIKTFNDEAQERFIDYWVKKGDGLQDKHGYELSVSEKATAYAIRFSLIFHMVRLHCSAEPNVSFQVDAKSLDAGIEISNWFLHEALRIENALSYNQKEIATLRFLEKTPRVGQPAHKVNSSSRLFKGVLDAQKTLKELMDKGRVCFVDPDRSPGIPGRPSDGTYRVIPESVSCNPTETPANLEVSMTEGGAV